MKIFSRALMVSGASVVLLAGGCKSFEDYRDERVEYAVRHFEKSQYADIDATKTLTLLDCVKYAVRNNLDLKVFGMEEQVAKEMRTGEMLGMLPELNISNNLTHRDNTPASSSRQLHGEGPGTYSYSQSQDRTVNYLNVDLALSVIDFGLAFFNTQQANDRMLMRQQQTRRAEQNLVLDVTRVYFQVAASQRAIKLTTQLLEDCKRSQELILELGKRGKITPFRAFDESRRFMEMEKRLKNYIRSYDNSCVELRSLMGVYPSGKIKVDDSILDIVPEFTFPEMALMEKIALMKRPELYQIDMQKHVNVLECRKTLVTMFPNVRLFLDFTNSNNSFLYHYSWWELGIRAAYNLLKLPQQIARYMAYSDQVDAEEYRAYAQAIAVMAQVRIAHANLMTAKEQLDINTRFYKAYADNLEKAEAGNRTSGELSQLELDHMRLTTVETEIEKSLSLGNYYVSYFRVLNTLGIENLHKATVEELEKEFETAKTAAAEQLAKDKEEFEAEQKKAAEAQAAKDAEFEKAEKAEKSGEAVKEEKAAEPTPKAEEKSPVDPAAPAAPTDTKQSPKSGK